MISYPKEQAPLYRVGAAVSLVGERMMPIE